MNEYLVTYVLENGSQNSTLERGTDAKTVHDNAVALWTGKNAIINLDTPAGVYVSFRSSDVVSVVTYEYTREAGS